MPRTPPANFSTAAGFPLRASHPHSRYQASSMSPRSGPGSRCVNARHELAAAHGAWLIFSAGTTRFRAPRPPPKKCACPPATPQRSPHPVRGVTGLFRFPAEEDAADEEVPGGDREVRPENRHPNRHGVPRPEGANRPHPHAGHGNHQHPLGVVLRAARASRGPVA